MGVPSSPLLLLLFPDKPSLHATQLEWARVMGIAAAAGGGGDIKGWQGCLPALGTLKRLQWVAGEGCRVGEGGVGVAAPVPHFGRGRSRIWPLDQ